MDDNDSDEAINELEELVRQGVLEDNISDGYGAEDSVYPVANGGGKWALGVSENAGDDGDSPYFFTVYELNDKGEVDGIWGDHFNTVDAINEARELMNKQQAAQPAPMAPVPVPANTDRLYGLHSKGPNMSPDEAVEYKNELQRYKDQHGRNPGYIGAWVNKNCKFAKKHRS